MGKELYLLKDLRNELINNSEYCDLDGVTFKRALDRKLFLYVCLKINRLERGY